MAGRIISWVLGILITGLYAYTVVTAVSNLILLPQLGASMDLSITATGWFWLIFGVVLPPVAYAVALFVGRRRSGALRVLVLATGICVVAAIQLEVTHLVPQSTFFA